MVRNEIDNRVFDVYKAYGIYHPDLLIVNWEISRSIIGPISSTVEYNIGKRIGKIIVDGCSELFEDDLLNVCFEIVEKSGWGKIDLDRDKRLVRSL